MNTRPKDAEGRDWLREFLKTNGDLKVRPSYYVYHLYQRFGEELLYASSDDPAVSVYAARRKDGALTLMIINLSELPAEKPLMLTGAKPQATAETYLFDAAYNAQQMPATLLDPETMLKLPPVSVTLYVIP